MQPSPSDGSGGMLLFALREGALYVASIFPGYNIMALYHQSLPSTEYSAALSSKTWKIRILQQELTKLIRVYL